MASSIDLVGCILGSYRIQKLIGQGAMGWVYQAYHTDLERVVAIKVLKADSTNQNKKALSLFKKEAQIASKIRHPNVITIYDFGVYHNRMYMVMEFLEGESLKTLLARVKKLTFSELLPILEEIVAGIESIHRHQLVHRDIKPENIFLDYSSGERIVKVLDFGLATLQQDDTMASSIVGTPVYMSPEQVKCEPLTAQSDIYALSAMVYVCLSGQLPVDQDSDPYSVMIKRAQGSESFRHLSELLSLPSELLSIVHQGMATHPKDRPTSAVAMIHKMKEYYFHYEWTRSQENFGSGRREIATLPPWERNAQSSNPIARKKRLQTQSSLNALDTEYNSAAEESPPRRYTLLIIGFASLAVCLLFFFAIIIYQSETSKDLSAISPASPTTSPAPLLDPGSAERVDPDETIQPSALSPTLEGASLGAEDINLEHQQIPIIPSSVDLLSPERPTPTSNTPLKKTIDRPSIKTSKSRTQRWKKRKKNRKPKKTSSTPKVSTKPKIKAQVSSIPPKPALSQKEMKSLTPTLTPTSTSTPIPTPTPTPMDKKRINPPSPSKPSAPKAKKIKAETLKKVDSPKEDLKKKKKPSPKKGDKEEEYIPFGF